MLANKGKRAAAVAATTAADMVAAEQTAAEKAKFAVAVAEADDKAPAKKAKKASQADVPRCPGDHEYRLRGDSADGDLTLLGGTSTDTR